MSASGERTNEIRTAPWNQGAGSGKSQGDVRASLGGSRELERAARVVGPGRALARGLLTGSWEGLPDDGRHLGSSRTALFHEGTGQAASASLSLILPTGAPRANTSASRPTGEGPGRSAAQGGATGVSEARSPRAPRVEQALGRGSRVKVPSRDACVPGQTRRSDGGCRETLPSLVVSRGAQTPRGQHAAQAAEPARNARGTGTRSFVRVADVDRTHRASWSPRSRKAPRCTQVASRKDARSLV